MKLPYRKDMDLVFVWESFHIYCKWIKISLYISPFERCKDVQDTHMHIYSECIIHIYTIEVIYIIQN